MTSYANDTTATSTASTTTAAAATNAESAASTTTTTTVDATAVQLNKDMSSNNNNHTRHYDDEDGREKADTTPENIKKIAEIINDKEAAEAAAAAATPSSPSMRLQQQQHHQHQTNASSFIGLGAAIDESNTKFCLGKPPPSPAEKAAVLSRANHHYHHRNSNNSSNSSSLNNKEISAADEDDSTASNSISTKQALSFTIDHFDASENDAAAQAARYKTMMERFQSRHRRGASMSKLESGTDDASVPATPTTETATTPAVKLRVRERSASRVRDASKRHSWSPRSSAAAAAEPAATPVSQRLLAATASKPKPMPPMQPAPAPKGAVNQLANRSTPFQARSTAMQMALQQVELLCPHPPLDDRKPDDDDDAVSEAGTYTLDGDNYTEEQKDLMNIDRNAAAAAAAAAAGKLRPKQLSVKPPSRASNVLEVNYYHETPQQQQEQKGGSNTATGVYLQQLKSRVLRQQQPQAAPPTPPSPPHSPAADVGCFTSVTTSGVLAKQRALDTHPKLTRHTHSLSTSQIDSSEYVSNEAKLRNAQAMAMAGSATDRQKAEYRLNVFTSSSNTQQQQQQHLHQLPETPTTPTEATMLQSAPTKQDWIQEWARNARARSLAQDVSGTSANRRKQQQQAQAQAQQLMTRSYNCSDTGADSLTDDSLSLYSQQQRQYAAAAKLNRSLARLLGDCDYASDPALCSHGGGQGGNGEPYKPPKSPSKIPSPLHTLGRARSASRSRPALEQMSSQTTSRRSSVKSPAAQCSPQHSLETTTTTTTSGYRRSPLHRALMTSSINEAQLQLLTSGEYLLKQLHRRKNSLELDVEPHELPGSMCGGVSGSISPLRRSSSFQQQQRPLQTMRQARPNFQNLYTPPAARHLQQQQRQQQQQQLQRELKKSASSNNFEHSYSDDYDNELQYYINDEDELGTTGPYYSSGEEEDFEQHQRQQSVQEPAVPLSNTRLNKALLMRIERSKQRVAGTGQTPSKPSSAPAGKLSVAQAAAAGLVACPNTPELPRRGIKSAPRAASGCGPKARQSMPRETSLSRLAQQVPSSLANAKKQLLQTANASNSSSSAREPRVQPKYLDISKYKPAQSNSFLRKNDAKSTLKPAEQMKRSPSASSMGLSRGDGTRASNRSVRSNTSVMNSSTTSLGGGGATGMRASSAARRDASMNKQKEAEMVMWKRRSTYDPMKAAAEDRRRKEEARRAQTQNQIEMQRHLNDVSNDAPFESVQRPANNLTLTGSINYSPRNSMENDAWTLGESSEFGEYPDDYDDDPEEHEDAEYVGGQESSDDVFEPETAEATN